MIPNAFGTIFLYIEAAIASSRLNGTRNDFYIYFFIKKNEPLRFQPFGPDLPSGLSLRVEDMAEGRPLR
jgi:hypothetical protein